MQRDLLIADPLPKGPLKGSSTSIRSFTYKLTKCQMWIHRIQTHKEMKFFEQKNLNCLDQVSSLHKE